MVRARGPLAAELGCRAGHAWLQLGCMRRWSGETRPLSWVRIYVDAGLAATLQLPPVLRNALFLLLERQSGESIAEIQQEIRATNLDAAMALRLAGDAALQITRRYFGGGQRLMMVAVSTLPSDRFFYSVSISRD